MTDVELAFGEFGDEKMKEITIIADWKSKESIPIVGQEMSDEDWARWCLGNIGSPSVGPRFPYHDSD
jgi:hypothetical protein